MTTLLLRLAGPLQAWGTQSRFRERDTGLEPSKSGVIGLLCAALGKPRDERPGDGFPTLAALAGLTMGVRVDAPGTMLLDYQTAGGGAFAGEAYGVRKASGTLTPGQAVLSNRYYLADADFLVGLEGTKALLERLDAALARPAWQLCLGRKAFVPGCPVRLPPSAPFGPGLREGGLETALRSYPWPLDRRRRPAEGPLRLALDAPHRTGGADVRQDVPLSFVERSFAVRYVRTDWCERPQEEG